MLGAHSSADDSTRSAHVDFLLSRLALLGQAQTYVGSATRCLVGREQDWFVSAAHRDGQRLARVLPRSTAHAFGPSLSPRLRSLRSTTPGQKSAARTFVDRGTPVPIRA